MRIVIIGGSGFIGRRMALEAAARGHEPVIISRNNKRAAAAFKDRGLSLAGLEFCEWDGKNPGPWYSEVDKADGVVNLAGEPIAAGKWTPQRKKRIVESRINVSRTLFKALHQVAAGSKVLVQASAVGYYGSRGEESLREDSGPGRGFLAETAKEWEKSAEDAARLGLRTVYIRTGVVLGLDGGALPRFLTPFKYFVGGHFGDGGQWFPWIHIEDQARAMTHLLENKEAEGPYNLAGPTPSRLKDFCRDLGRVMGRPSWAPLPGFLLRALMGEMADELLLTSQKISSEKLEDSGFVFKHRTPLEALRDILGSGSPRV